MNNKKQKDVRLGKQLYDILPKKKWFQAKCNLHLIAKGIHIQCNLFGKSEQSLVFGPERDCNLHITH